MFGLVRKKTLEAMEGLLTTCEQEFRKEHGRLRGLEEVLANQVARTEALEHQRGVSMRVAESAEKERDRAVADFAALQSLHAKRVRIGTFTVNPLKLTAQLRAIEPTLRVEYDGDKVVVYSETLLKEEVHRAVASFLNGQWDRT